MPEEINFYSRKEEYGWLSNFDRTAITVTILSSSISEIQRQYKSVEHFYQSQKALDPAIQHWIKTAPNPYLAMKAGRSLRKHEFRPDWEQVKVQVMLIGLRAKFQNTELRHKLLETGDAILHEDSPTDLFWGKKGKDMLGKLLMQVREEIKSESLNSQTTK